MLSISSKFSGRLGLFFLIWLRCQLLLLRKDKYNRNIMKYHVEVDTDDSDADEDLEREVKTSSKAGKNTNYFVELFL